MGGPNYHIGPDYAGPALLQQQVVGHIEAGVTMTWAGAKHITRSSCWIILVK